MQAVRNRIVRWSGVVAVSVAIAACGGGGGGAGSNPGAATAAPAPPAPVGDARNGTYTMVAADARVYTLDLDFDAKTWHVAGNSVDSSGSLQEDAGTFLFVPGNGTGANGFSTLRFQMAPDTAIGEFALPSGAVPFVAGRKFVTSVTEAVGAYNILGRSVDTGGGAPDTTIQQGEITADGHLRTCEDSGIFDMPNCPASSILTGTITVAGDLFTATTANGSIPFRVAQVGTDKVFLRASGSLGTTRRFLVGVPATPPFADGTFVGGTTEPAWGKVVIAGGNLTSIGKTPAGSTNTVSGTLFSSGFVPGIEAGTLSDGGLYFTVRSSDLGVAVASRGSTAAPGFMAIGRKQ